MKPEFSDSELLMLIDTVDDRLADKERAFTTARELGMGFTAENFAIPELHALAFKLKTAYAAGGR